MLNKHNLDIARLAPSEEESRYTLSCVYVTPTETVETDGHQLIKVTVAASKGDTPLVPEEIAPVEQFEPFMLPRGLALEVAESLSKSDKVKLKSGKRSKVTKKPRNAAIGKNSDKNGHAVFGISDTSGSERIFKFRKAEGKYPQYNMVIPDEKKAQATVSLNLSLLIPVLQQMKKFNPGFRGLSQVTLRLGNENDPVRLDAKNEETGQVMTAVIMPMRS